MTLLTFSASGIWVCLGIIMSIMTYKLVSLNTEGKSWKYKLGNLLSYLLTLLLSGFFFGIAMWIVYLG